MDRGSPKFYPVVACMAVVSMFAPVSLGSGPETKPCGSRGNNVSGLPAATRPEVRGRINLKGVGSYEFDPEKVESASGDIFNGGSFSVFGILAHRDSEGKIRLSSHYDEGMNSRGTNRSGTRKS